MRNRVRLGLVLCALLTAVTAAGAQPSAAELAAFFDAEVPRLMEKFHVVGAVAGMADRVNVMYAGNLLEVGPVASIFENAFHPYTRLLIESIPSIKEKKVENPAPAAPESGLQDFFPCRVIRHPVE